MKIATGCTINRETWERTNLYREGSPADVRALAEAILRASSAARQEGLQAAKIREGKES